MPCRPFFVWEGVGLLTRQIDSHVGPNDSGNHTKKAIAEHAPVCGTSMLQENKVINIYVDISQEGNMTVYQEVCSDGRMQLAGDDSGVNIIVWDQRVVR